MASYSQLITMFTPSLVLILKYMHTHHLWDKNTLQAVNSTKKKEKKRKKLIAMDIAARSQGVCEVIVVKCLVLDV